MVCVYAVFWETHVKRTNHHTKALKTLNKRISFIQSESKH